MLKGEAVGSKNSAATVSPTRAIAEAHLMVILRGLSTDRLPQAAQVLRESGIRVVEVAMNSPQAVRQLRLLRDFNFCLGAGTILSKDDAHAAVDAGAEFLFSPTDPPFFRPFCEQRRVLGIPGALTPSEVYSLYSSGIPYIKLFPAMPLGSSYLRQLLGPCPGLQLIPTGGVTLPAAEQFLAAGAVAVAVGSEIASPELVVAQRFQEIAERARAFVSLVEKVGPHVVRLRS
ncbi:MAG: bifunctional 4-hydroxy-2-oxoglutarate aldolase/2-dehydro-3-deoxy-phosphogluconate aldolase [Acidobacteria bacterium]|nr:bifunctional 4-hydroxy-2-oxoglutarate aldolase/2-dehydro-3-deoxy-phosphogluconate aldolase [Acidobacteriota bacterium]